MRALPTMVWALAVLFFVLALSPMACRAASFSASVSPNATLANLTSKAFNVTFANNDTYLNITSVVITLPTGFAFVEASNGTGSSAAFANASATSLVWGNLTGNDTIVANGTSSWFSFNASVPSSGAYSLNVTAYDNNSAVTVAFLGLVVDSVAPSVTLNYPSNASNLSTSSVNFNWTAADNNSTALNCSLYVDTQYNSSLQAANGSYTNMTVYGLSQGQHNWTVACNDSLGNAANATGFFGAWADLDVPSIEWASGSGNHTVAGDNVTVWALARNPGSFNVSSNVTLYLYWDSAATPLSNFTVANGSLTAGSSTWIKFPQNITSGVTNGLHNIIVRMDALGNVSESNESNDFYHPISVGYNVTVNSISPQSAADLVNLTINVSVRYANGDAVTGLTKYNVSVGDYYGGSLEDTFDYQDAVFNTTFDSTHSADGVYLFAMSSWFGATNPMPGYHNITVGASNGNYTGSSSGNDRYYLLVPTFTTFSLSSSDYQINEGGSTQSFTILLNNTGTANATGVRIIGIRTDDTDKLYNITSCSSAYSVPNGTSATSTCSVTFKTGTVGGDESFSIYITVAANTTSNNTITMENIISSNWITVTNTVDNPGTTTPASGAAAAAAAGCGDDSDGAAAQSCVSGECAAVSCPDGEVVNHACVPYSYDVSIMRFPQSLTVVWGAGSNDSQVVIQNTGERSASFSLSVTSAIPSAVAPEGCSMDPSEQCTFDVSFATNESLKVGNYSGTFKAFRTGHQDESDSRTFYFVILPTDAQKAGIRQDYTNVTALARAIIARFMAVNGSAAVNDSDKAAVMPLIDELAAAVGQADGYITAEDYANVNTVLDEMNAKMSAVAPMLGELELKAGVFGSPGGTWLWIAVAVVIILAAALLLYMMLPQKPGRYKRASFVPSVAVGQPRNPRASPAEAKNGGEFSLLDYGSGYKKHQAYSYEYGRKEERKRGRLGSFLSRLKPKGREPQRSLAEFVSP
jgi:hypothetical protein